jgi:hypothetical protein
MMEQQIEHIFREAGIEHTPPVDVEKIASRFGIRVISTPLPGKVGEIIFNADSTTLIKIDPFENSYQPRYRFTLAHELGHFFLHRVLGYTYEDTKETIMDRKNTYWDGKEGEANSFASQLLMPTKLIEVIGMGVISQSNNILIDDFIIKMAQIFNVSKQSMRFRLVKLGVIKA